jgi:hypothetical protein
MKEIHSGGSGLVVRGMSLAAIYFILYISSVYYITN